MDYKTKLQACIDDAQEAVDKASALPGVDDTLTKSGSAADAKVTGDRLNLLSEEKVDKQQDAENAGKLLYISNDGTVTPLALGAGLKIENGILMITNAVVAHAVCGEFVCGEIVCGGAK